MDNATLLTVATINTVEEKEVSNMDINTIIAKAVAEFMSYKDNATKYADYTATMVTVNHPITTEDFVTLVSKVRNYDQFTAYIDNYKQQQAAEKANENYNEEWKAIFTNYNIDACDINFVACNCGATYSRLHTSEEAVAEYINKLFKEEETMNNKTNVAINETKNNKEEIKMVGQMNQEMIKVLDTMNKTMQLVQVLEWCSIKNVHDTFYVRKDVLAKFLFNKDLICRDLTVSKKELSKIKRDELIENLANTVANLVKTEVITPIKAYSVNPLDDMDLNAPINDEEDGVVVEKKEDVDMKNNKKEEFNMEQYWNQKVATAIIIGTTRGKSIKDDRRKGAGIINHMANNRYHDFISEYMLTSVIAEVLTGKPLKHWDATTRTMVDSKYAQVEIDTIKYVREKFIERYLYQKTGDKNGYRLRADIIQWACKCYGINTITFGVWDNVTKRWKVIYDVTDNVLVIRGKGTIMDIHGDDFRKLEWDNVVFITEVK